MTKFVEPRRAVKAGRNRVDADVLGREFLRRATHQMVQRGFRRAVRDLLAHAARAGKRADEGEGAAARFSHGGRAVLQREECMTQDDAELPVPFLVREIRQRLEARHADNVDHTAHRAERGSGFLEDARYLVSLGYVRDAGMALDRPGDRLGTPGITVDTEDFCAGLGQRMRSLLADALVAPSTTNPYPVRLKSEG